MTVDDGSNARLLGPCAKLTGVKGALASAWLAQPLPVRSIAFYDAGAIAVGQHYDALVYFDHSTPSKPLP